MSWAGSWLGLAAGGWLGLVTAAIEPEAASGAGGSGRRKRPRRVKQIASPAPRPPRFPPAPRRLLAIPPDPVPSSAAPIAEAPRFVNDDEAVILAMLSGVFL